MSVIVLIKVPADPTNVEKLWADRGSDFESVAADAKSQGAIHHRWGFGEDFVLAIDEWPDAQSFQGFFANQQTIPQLMQAAGATGAPEVTIIDAVTGPDQF